MSNHQQEVVRFLTGVPLFAGLQERQIRNLVKRMRERTYHKGDGIVEQAKMGVGLFIIVSGECDVIRLRPDGTTFVVDTLGPKQFFGELSLLDEAPRTASVIAKADTTCLVLTQLDFLDAIREDAEMAIAVMKELAARFRRVLSHM